LEKSSCTAIPIIIGGHGTAFNGFKFQFTAEKPLKNLKLTLNCCELKAVSWPSVIMRMAVNTKYIKAYAHASDAYGKHQKQSGNVIGIFLSLIIGYDLNVSESKYWL
jgi:hypothetical protein